MRNDDGAGTEETLNYFILAFSPRNRFGQFYCTVDKAFVFEIHKQSPQREDITDFHFNFLSNVIIGYFVIYMQKGPLKRCRAKNSSRNEKAASVQRTAAENQRKKSIMYIHQSSETLCTMLHRTLAFLFPDQQTATISFPIQK